eukprot:9142-Heterococcus_DN1.PRE.2
MSACSSMILRSDKSASHTPTALCLVHAAVASTLHIELHHCSQYSSNGLLTVGTVHTLLLMPSTCDPAEAAVAQRH